MDHMKILHISELNKNVQNGQLIMVLGWIENYLPQDGGKAKLFSTESENMFAFLCLSGCGLVDVAEHTLCRVIGRFYLRNNGLEIKVCSLKAVSSWKYYTFSQIIEKQRSLMMKHKDY